MNTISPVENAMNFLKIKHAIERQRLWDSYQPGAPQLHGSVDVEVDKAYTLTIEDITILRGTNVTGITRIKKDVQICTCKYAFTGQCNVCYCRPTTKDFYRLSW